MLKRNHKSSPVHINKTKQKTSFNVFYQDSGEKIVRLVRSYYSFSRLTDRLGLEGRGAHVRAGKTLFVKKVVSIWAVAMFYSGIKEMSQIQSNFGMQNGLRARAERKSAVRGIRTEGDAVKERSARWSRWIQEGHASGGWKEGGAGTIYPGSKSAQGI